MAEVAEPDSELTGRWAREAPWDGDRISMRSGRPEDECSECEGPLLWEPGRTLTYCPECHAAGLPAAVAAHYQRQSQRSAEVAVRSGADPAAVRAGRVRLRALSSRMAERIGEWLEVFDPDDLNGGPARLALDYRAELAAYLPEIKNAADETELAEIMADVNEVTERARTSGALDQIERQREAIERQAELAERQAQAAELAELQARAAERAEREAQQRAAIEARQRKAIETRKPAPVSSGNGYGQAALMIASMVEAKRKAKEEKLEKYGSCGYTQQHKSPVVAERRYWIMTLDWSGNESGYELPGAPSVGACKKHFAAADAWIEEQAALLMRQQSVRVKAVYTELT